MYPVTTRCTPAYLPACLQRRAFFAAPEAENDLFDARTELKAAAAQLRSLRAKADALAQDAEYRVMPGAAQLLKVQRALDVVAAVAEQPGDDNDFGRHGASSSGGKHAPAGDDDIPLPRGWCGRKESERGGLLRPLLLLCAQGVLVLPPLPLQQT